MKRRLIPTAKVKQLATEGYGVSEIADKLEFTKSAISKALKRMNVAVVKETARQAPVIVEKGINAIDQLQTINDHANWLLDHLMRWTKGDDEAIQILESQVANKKVRVGGEVEFVKEYKFRDPRELALKAMLEIRGQLNLQLDIFKTLYDLRAMKEFQEEVLAVIGEVDADVRQRIIDNLKKRRAIHSTLEFN